MWQTGPLEIYPSLAYAYDASLVRDETGFCVVTYIVVIRGTCQTHALPHTMTTIPDDKLLEHACRLKDKVVVITGK
jgi:hypothetical protein